MASPFRALTPLASRGGGASAQTSEMTLTPSRSAEPGDDLNHSSQPTRSEISAIVAEAVTAALEKQAESQREMIQNLMAGAGAGAPPSQNSSSGLMTVAHAARRATFVQRRVSSAPPADAAAEKNDKAASYTSLQAGDLITLRVSEHGLRGCVLGSMAERTAAVEAEAGFDERPMSLSSSPPGSSGSHHQVTRRFDDCVFRICPKLNYRAQTELNRIQKAAWHTMGPEEEGEEKASALMAGLEKARARAQNERAHNDEALAKLHSLGVAGVPLKYGDVIQLEHHKSQLFLAMHKTPAPVNSNCRKVSLKAGSYAAHFRILPRFKVRSIGSLVYANDEIVLQSVKFDPMVLGASGQSKDMLPSARGSSSSSFAAHHLGPPDLGVRLPTALRHGACFEVNGAMELRSFTVKLYARFAEKDKHSLITGLHRFRLFHPEGSAFLSASGDADKGEVLDARDPSKQRRTRPLPPASVTDGRIVGPIPAHVPYLKSMTGDVSNPANFSAKAVWRFETLDRKVAATVKWRTPLRLRHVPSDKYLSVDSLNPTKLSKARAPFISSMPRSPMKGASGGVSFGARAGEEGKDGESASNATLYNAALVSDVDESAGEGAFGSASSLIFTLVPTDVTGDTLKHGVSTLRIEHRTSAGLTLHFMSPREPKPSLTPLSSTDDEDLQVAGGKGEGKHSGKGSLSVYSAASMQSKQQALALEKKGGRLLFSSQSSSVDVLKLLPLTDVEGRRIDTLCSRVRLFRLYTNLYQTFDLASGSSGAHALEGPPVHMCEAVASQCLALIDDLRKGESPPPRHSNIADAMKEANTTLPALFATFFSGEADSRMQRIAMEVKVLDAVFEAALAPYNRAINSSRPFQLSPANDQPKALAMFLYVTLQRGLGTLLAAQEYFARRSSRTWSSSSFPSSGGGGGDAESEAAAAAAVSGPAPAGAVIAVRRWTLWRNIIIDQGEDSLGATVTLSQLLSASESIVAKLVSNELMARFKGLIKRCGPEPRLINLFSSICTVAGKPSPANQEMCVRTLWMNLVDRYNLGVTFHEGYPKGDTKTPQFGSVVLPSGAVVGTDGHMRRRAPESAPAAFLGKTPENEYGMVCVAWTGTDEWVGDCGKLFWSANKLEIPIVGGLDTGKPEEPPKGGVGVVDLVPIESLMWVLEPAMLCEAVTGKKWRPLDEGKDLRARKSVSRSRSHGSVRHDFGSFDIGSLVERPDPEKQRAEVFRKQTQLATYAVAQIKLLTQMCTGRSNNCIRWVEKSFSYSCLLNMSSNPRLPCVFRSAVLDFVQALYVDRYPQLVNSGAPCLPELLWIYQDPNNNGVRKSTTPVVQPLTLTSEAAFPSFFVSPLSNVAADPDPIISFPTHFKFFLLRVLCNNIITSFGESGRIVHSLAAHNELGAASLRGQQGLLDFGFQSTYVKLKDLCKANAKLLDGRCDLDKPGVMFDPPERRYHESGGLSAVVTKMKREVIQLFLDVADLRANYRLAKLLHLFETHAEQIQVEEYQSLNPPVDDAVVRASLQDVLGPDAASFDATSSQRDGGLHRPSIRENSAVGNWDSTTKLVGGGMGRLQSRLVKGEGARYLLGQTEADVKNLYDDFESMFPGGSDDASKLDLTVLGDKPDMDQALVDCLMYEDDALMESALELLDRTYGQRRALRQALQDAILLPRVELPVFGDIHALRNCLNDLRFQTRTATSWGVKSRISGAFDGDAFGAMMANVDKVLVFLHTSPIEATTPTSPAPKSPGGTTSSYFKSSSSEVIGVMRKASSLTFKRKTPASKLNEDSPRSELGPEEGSNSDEVPLYGKENNEVKLNYQGYFKETDLQGNTYECKGLWSLDVAAKWSKGGNGSAVSFGGKSCHDHHHQSILRACNLQAVLAEGLVMDHEIAWKGSICTEREKHESERRLTLAKRALLHLATAFVDGNRKNQEVLFEHMGTLQALATPASLQDGAKASRGFDERRANTITAKVKSSSDDNARSDAAIGVETGAAAKNLSTCATSEIPGSQQRWPFTVPELAQDLIMHILRRNENLCDRIKRPLIELFASLVDHSADCSAAPTLDLLFILAMPHDRPIRDNQTEVAEILLSSNTFPNLAKAVCKAVVAPAGGVGKSNSARLVRLLCAVMENKNEYAASQLMQHANLSIDATCSALVELVNSAIENFAMETTTGTSQFNKESISGSSIRNLNESNLSVLAAKSVMCGDMGGNLLSLLAEQVFLLPMNAVQIMSKPMWEFLAGPTALALEAFTSVECMNPSELTCCENLFDVLEHVFTVLQRLGLMDDVFSDQTKAGVVLNLSNDVQSIVKNRELTPDFLKHAYCEALFQSGHKVGLDREGFKRLVMELDKKHQNNDVASSFNSSSFNSGSFLEQDAQDFGESGDSISKKSLLSPVLGKRGAAKVFPSSSTPRLLSNAKHENKADFDAQLEAAFDLADSDGNRYVDLYEFIGLYYKVTKQKSVGSDITAATGLSNEGHALSMRTVEYGERIMSQSRNGQAVMLQPAQFQRSDKYPAPEKQGRKCQKLFQAAPTTKTKKQEGEDPAAAAAAVVVETPLRTLEQRFNAFKATVASNTRILGALQRRRFSMVCVLEAGLPPPPLPGHIEKELATRLADGKYLENPLCSAVAAGWSDVSKRFVAYCTEHFYDEEGAGRRTVQLILTTWMAHLVKARTLVLEEDGVTPAESIASASILRQVTPHELSEDLYVAYRGKQEALNSLGVTELLGQIIANVDDAVPGGLPDLALELFVELLNGGCVEAADALYQFLVRVDTEGKFLKHIDRRIDLGLESLREAKSRGGFGGDPEWVMSDDVEASCDDVIATTRFMQLMCEGHNLKFQNLLRVQPMYAGQFNLVNKVVEALVLLCESTAAVSCFHRIELLVVSQMLALLIELMQGPCPGNQEVIVDSEALVAINNIIPSVNAHDRKMSLVDPNHMDIRGQACVLLAACLEGREDFDCHKTMMRKLETSALFGYQSLIEAEIRSIRANALGRLLDLIEEQKVATLQAALVAVVTVEMELRQEKKQTVQEKKAQADVETKSPTKEDVDSAPLDNDQVDDKAATPPLGEAKGHRREVERLCSQPLVGIVEVAWHGLIERNVFAMPFEVEYLTAATKEKFLEEVNLSTTEKRMSELMQHSDAFIAEMRLIHDKAEQSRLFRALHRRMPTFKTYLYALVVILNVNVLMAPNKLESPARALMHLFSSSSDRDLKLSLLETTSLGVTVLLFLLVLSAYCVIIGHLAATEVPMVIRELKAEWDSNLEEGVNPTNRSAWAVFVGFCCLAALFVGIHVINFVSVPGWYLTFALLLVPVYMYTYRSSILRPTSQFQRRFCVCFDLMMTRSFLRNHALLAVCSVLGIYDIEFFTLELLDIVNISSVIGDIIKSVTAPGKALFFTLYLFIVTSVIYASFGMAFFPDQLQVPKEFDEEDLRRLFGSDEDEQNGDGWGELYGDEGEMHDGEEEEGGRSVYERFLLTKRSSDSVVTKKETCHTLLQCTLFVFYQGMSEAGNLKSVLRTASPGSFNYIPRIIYDSVYFVWVGIVLVNIITGLMVDTFSAIRGDKADRAETLETDCFVCGMQRSAYEDLGLKPGSPSFAHHLARDHDLWTYVYFVAYLKKKDPTEYNGIESYVRGEIDNRSLEWVPSRTSFVLQEQGKGGGSTDTAATALKRAKNAYAAVAVLEEKIDTILVKLGPLDQLANLQRAVGSLAASQQQQQDEN